MVKILLILIVCVAVGVGVYLRFFRSSSEPLKPITAPILNNSDSSDEKFKVLESAVLNLAEQLNQLKQKPAQAQTDDSRIKGLEVNVSDLQSRIAKLESGSSAQTTTQTTTSNNNKVPVYIPLGSTTQTSDQNWVTFTDYAAQIDPASYSGYKNMQLEVNMRLNQPGGSINARLISTDGSVISGSQTSVSSTQFTLSQSGGFTLPSGNKTYQLQLQSTNGTPSFVQTARIKVNF